MPTLLVVPKKPDAANADFFLTIEKGLIASDQPLLFVRRLVDFHILVPLPVGHVGFEAGEFAALDRGEDLDELIP